MVSERGMLDKPLRITLKKMKCDKEKTCEYWYPPECTFHKKGRCNKGNKCPFLRNEMAKKVDEKRN